jgi:opine dehydrogenase
MKITILGSGHGGCTLAAMMAKKGHTVSILKIGTDMHMENFRALKSNRTIRSTGIEGNGEFSLNEVTTDPSEVIPQAELIFICYVTNFHPMISSKIGEYLHKGQTVVLLPGYAGSLIFSNTLKTRGTNDFPLFAEFETLPYTSRITNPGTINIMSRNVRHIFATYPASRSREIVDILEPILGDCIPRRHIFEVALHNPNLVIHTLGVLLNVALVESKEKKFAMYRDGFTPSMWNLIFRLDDEKMNVLEKLGAPRISYLDEFKLRTFRDTSIDSFKGFMHYASETPDGPFTLNHRYVMEDVPIGLGLLNSLGKAVNVSTPICDSLLNIATGLLPDHDFWKEARTLDQLWSGRFSDLMKELTA